MIQVIAIAPALMYSRILAYGQTMVYNDFFENIKIGLENFAGSLQTVTGAIAIVCLIAAGIMFFFGGEGVRAGKRQLLWVLVGIAVVSGAVSIVSAIQNTFTF